MDLKLFFYIFSINGRLEVEFWSCPKQVTALVTALWTPPNCPKVATK